MLFPISHWAFWWLVAQGSPHHCRRLAPRLALTLGAQVDPIIIHILYSWAVGLGQGLGIAGLRHVVWAARRQLAMGLDAFKLLAEARGHLPKPCGQLGAGALRALSCIRLILFMSEPRLMGEHPSGPDVSRELHCVTGESAAGCEVCHFAGVL